MTERKGKKPLEDEPVNLRDLDIRERAQVTGESGLQAQVPKKPHYHGDKFRCEEGKPIELVPNH